MDVLPGGNKKLQYIEEKIDLVDETIQALVVQRLDNAIHRINHYPADRMVCFVNTYPLDSDLSGG